MAGKPSKNSAKIAYQAFKAHVDYLSTQFVGREEMTEVMALALLSKGHAFFLSPPGTAKSAIIRNMAGALEMNFFGIQMRDDTKVEELMGMWDLPMLEQGRYVRKWARAADCELLYLNEAFKGSSNALNSVLGLINEREVDDEKGYRQCPLWSAFLDSNELPRDRKALCAFFDRVLLKLPLDYVNDPVDFKKLIAGPKAIGAWPDPLSRKQLELLHGLVKEVKPYSGYLDDMLQIRASLQISGITVTDRTWSEACGLIDPSGNPRATPIRAHAFWKGRKAMKPMDLLVLMNIFWLDPSDRSKIRRAILKAVMPQADKAEEILDHLIDVHAAAIASRRRDDMAAAMDTASIAKREVKEMSTIDADLIDILLAKINNIHAELAQAVMTAGALR